MPQPTASRRPTGSFVVVALFAFGMLFVGGLYWVAMRRITPEYRSAKPAVPAAAITLASCDLGWATGDELDRLTDAMLSVKADVWCFQRISRSDAQRLAKHLGMRHAGEAQWYYSPTNADEPDEPGNAIMARLPVYWGRAVPNPGARNFAIAAEVITGDAKFLLVCADLDTSAQNTPRESDAVLAAWRKWRQPPMIIVATLAADSASSNSLGTFVAPVKLAPATSPATLPSRRPGLYCTPQWSPRDASVIDLFGRPGVVVVLGGTSSR